MAVHRGIYGVLVRCAVGIVATLVVAFTVSVASAEQNLAELDQAFDSGDLPSVFEALETLETFDEATSAWVADKLNRLDARFAGLLARKTAARDSEASLRWGFVAAAWALQDSAECLDSTARQGIVSVLGGLEQVHAIARRNPDLEVAAFQSAIEWVSANPSPSDALWVCLHGVQAGPEAGSASEGQVSRRFLKDPATRGARQAAIVAALRSELASLKERNIEQNTISETETARSSDQQSALSARVFMAGDGLVLGFPARVFWVDGETVLFYAIRSDEVPEGNEAYRSLNRRHDFMTASVEEVAEGQARITATGRLWDVYIWRPGMDDPKILYTGPWVSVSHPVEGQPALKIGCIEVHEALDRCAVEALIVGLPENPQTVARLSEWARIRLTPVPTSRTKGYGDTNGVAYGYATGDVFVRYEAPYPSTNTVTAYHAWESPDTKERTVLRTEFDGTEIRACHFNAKSGWLPWIGGYRFTPCAFDSDGRPIRNFGYDGACRFPTGIFVPGGNYEIRCHGRHVKYRFVQSTNVVRDGLLVRGHDTDRGNVLVLHFENEGTEILDTGYLGIPTVSENGCWAAYSHSETLVGTSRTRGARVTLRAVRLCDDGEG